MQTSESPYCGWLSYKFQGKQNFVGELIRVNFWTLWFVVCPRSKGGKPNQSKNLRQSITRFFQHETNGLGNCSFFFSFFFSPPSPYSLTSDNLTQPWKLHHRHHLLPSCSPSLSYCSLCTLYNYEAHKFWSKKTSNKKVPSCACHMSYVIMSFLFFFGVEMEVSKKGMSNFLCLE